MSLLVLIQTFPSYPVSKVSSFKLQSLNSGFTVLYSTCRNFCPVHDLKERSVNEHDLQ